LGDSVSRRAIGQEVKVVGADEVVLDVNAVQGYLRPGRTATVDVGVRSVCDRRRPSLRANQIERVAVKGRQVLYLIHSDRIGNLVTGGIDQLLSSSHLNYLGCLPNF